MNAQEQLLATYGEPDAAYQTRYCMIWEIKKDFQWFPANKMLINKDFKIKLWNAFEELEKKELQNEIKTFDGCYNDRSVRGRTSKSLHAWAAAIDINASIEKLTQSTTHWSEDFLHSIKSNGIFWGGDFHRPDPMHFCLLPG